MRLIVEVRWGSLHGQKRVLEPGMALRIGRVGRADFVFEHDREMSTVHCELQWDGTMCRVFDLNSVKGIQLNGEKVREAVVPHGAWLKAGSTNFLVYFEEHTPPLLGADVTMTEAKVRALCALEAEPDSLFAVLDAARDDRILVLLRESVEEHRSLYEGIQGHALEDYAPYLVALPKGTRLLRRLVAEGWGRRWGTYLTSRRPFREVRTHLRRLLVVDAHHYGRVYFRFYDPVVLGTFLPSCSVRQFGDFFGEMSTFLAEGDDGAPLRFERPKGDAD